MSADNKAEEQNFEEQEQSEISDEDDDAQLLTDRVEEKLLSTLARIKMKHPSIYLTKEPLYQQEDFQIQTKPNGKHKHQKFTYKDLMKEDDVQASQQEQPDEELEDLPPAVQEKRAKQSFKKALNKKAVKNEEEDDEQLFTVKTKLQIASSEPQDQRSKLKQLTKNFDKQTRKLIKKAWKSEELDETDLFLKDYILDKKWLSSKLKAHQNPQEAIIEQEDENRSQEMDVYEAQYNFRYEQPGGTAITQYPRKVRDSLRQKVQTRKEKRKNRQKNKKQEQAQIRKQAQQKKTQLKKTIMERLAPKTEEEDHDWFFCDDCCRGLFEGETIWECEECQDYMLCEACNQIIIHKHPLNESLVPEGCGAPPECESTLQELKSCRNCRRRITPNQKRFEYRDRSYVVNCLCSGCYDQSNLQIKKKFKEVQPQNPDIEQLLDQNPQKIKELTNLKQIEEMVDEYIHNDFEGILSGGLKTKFRYIPVKPQSYGLSDEQILFGDDKVLNKYVSIKQLAAYNDERLRLRNNFFSKKVKTIDKSVRTNKKLVAAGEAKLRKVRQLSKMRQRAEAVKQRRFKRLRILNLSTKEAERNHFVSQSRLLSYGITQEE